MQFYAHPAPSGAAIRLSWSLDAPAHTPLIIATASPTPPTNPLAPQPGERVVVNALTPTRLGPNPFVLDENPARDLHQMLDLDKSLGLAPVTYHLYALNGAAIAAGPTNLTVNATSPIRTASVPVVRDFVRGRLEYHLARFVAANQVKPSEGFVPILEQDSLTRDDPMPCILLKEMLAPLGNEAIGKYARSGKDENGNPYREQRYRYRARVDMLIVSVNPSERTDLATLLHGALEIDKPLFEDVGFRAPNLTRAMESGRTPENFVRFGESITVDGEVDVIVRQGQLYRVVSPDLVAGTFKTNL